MKKNLLLILLLFTSRAYAVRPFVTDDARIVSAGQFEMELWPEVNLVADEQTYAFQGMFGYSFNEWFELIVGSGHGYDRQTRTTTTSNPVITPKFLLYSSQLEAWIPGVALGIGTNLNYGRGSLYDDASSYFGLVIFTWRFWRDRLNLHLNLGNKLTYFEKHRIRREQWGLGLDVGLWDVSWRGIAEAYSGDPIEGVAPRQAYQAGVRWLRSEEVNFDFTLGTQREAVGLRREGERREYWFQVGIRLLFDTPYAEATSAEGARGLFARDG